MLLRKRTLGLLLALAWPLSSGVGYGAEAVAPGTSVAVRLEGGRVFTGEVDAATDDHRLWLRTTAPGIALSRSVAWADILGVEHGGKECSAAEFRPVAEQIKTPLPDDFFASPKARPAHSPAPRTAPARPSRVASLEIEARIANWDADVEPDGLEVRIWPLDERGRAVAVDGDLDVRLIGQRIAGPETREVFPELGHWGELVRSAEVKPWGAVFRLPFRTVRPDFDLEYSPEGVVHARLGVAGQGVFDASTWVYLRTAGRPRDELQLRRNVRFFPVEHAR